MLPWFVLILSSLPFCASCHFMWKFDRRIHDEQQKADLLKSIDQKPNTTETTPKDEPDLEESNPSSAANCVNQVGDPDLIKLED